jgi:hypothetical protein
MYDGSTSGHAVGRRAGGRPKDNPIRLDGCQVNIVAKAFQGGQVRRGASVNDDFIQNVELRSNDAFAIHDLTT